MTNLPLAIFLAPYAIFVLAYSFFFFFNVFHLKEFGVDSGKTRFLIFAYIGCTVLIIGGSALLLAQFDWSQTIDFSTLAGSVASGKIPSL